VQVILGSLGGRTTRPILADQLNNDDDDVWAWIGDRDSGAVVVVVTGG
jgi:hypothetical protein